MRDIPEALVSDPLFTRISNNNQVAVPAALPFPTDLPAILHSLPAILRPCHIITWREDSIRLLIILRILMRRRPCLLLKWPHLAAAFIPALFKSILTDFLFQIVPAFLSLARCHHNSNSSCRLD